VNTETLQDAFLKLVNHYEKVIIEKACLKEVLRNGAEPLPGYPPLQEQIDGMIRQWHDGPLHEQFDSLREEIRQTTEAHKLVELLRKLSPGEVN
jgi:hypothetical protein